MASSRGIQNQLNCVWESVSFQSDLILEGTKSTITSSCKGVEFWAERAAKYIFGIDNRSSKNRNLVLMNVVTPLSLAIVATALISGKAALALAVAYVVYALVLSKKKGYI